MPTVVAGHSAGCEVALEVAAQCEDVKTVVLYCPPPAQGTFYPGYILLELVIMLLTTPWQFAKMLLGMTFKPTDRVMNLVAAGLPKTIAENFKEKCDEWSGMPILVALLKAIFGREFDYRRLANKEVILVASDGDQIIRTKVVNKMAYMFSRAGVHTKVVYLQGDPGHMLMLTEKGDDALRQLG